MAFLRIMSAIKQLEETLEGDEATGAKILFNSLEKPTSLIVRNAGLDAGKILGELENRAKAEKNIGFDVIAMDYVVDGKRLELVDDYDI